MNRAMWQQHLAQAERHVAEARRHVARQHQIVFELTRDGYDATKAKAILTTLEATLKLHTADLDRLLSHPSMTRSSADAVI